MFYHADILPLLAQAEGIAAPACFSPWRANGVRWQAASVITPIARKAGACLEQCIHDFSGIRLRGLLRGSRSPESVGIQCVVARG